MYWPSKTEELLVIYCLGTENEKLYASSIARKIKNQRYCSKHVMDESKGSYINAIKKLVEEGIIEESREYVQTTGARGVVLQLTSNGLYIFNQIKDLYPVLDYIAPFQELIYKCETCTNDELKRCYEIQHKDLDLILEKHYPIPLNKRKHLIQEISACLKAPMSLGEFNFLLTMNVVAEKRLKDKYPTLFKKITSLQNTE